MTWEQRLQALSAVTPGLGACLRMRHTGNWYVEMTGVMVLTEDGLVGSTQSGKTPELAVEECWSQYAASNRIDVDGKRFRWNGFMWAEEKK